MSSKKTPGINSTSTADIAFLLLCYFLMSSSMGSQSGLSRRLPPMPAENQQLTDQKVNRRNIIVVRINSSDRLFAGSEPMDISQLKDRIKVFLTNPTNDPDLPERKMTQIEGLGEYAVSQGVISLQNDRGTSYQAYIAVQNELVKAINELRDLVKAINELRDEFSLARYGKVFTALDEDTQEIVKDAIPQNISEAEPVDVGNRR